MRCFDSARWSEHGADILHAAAFNAFYTARVISIVTDILVVVFTWMKTRRLAASACQLGFMTSLSCIVLRSGTSEQSLR